MLMWLFQNQVNQVVIPDYGNWVGHGDEMWLERIKQRVARREYASRAAFLADFERLLANAHAYNDPGHGELGDQGDDSIGAACPMLERILITDRRTAWHVDVSTSLACTSSCTANGTDGAIPVRRKILWLRRKSVG